MAYEISEIRLSQQIFYYLLEHHELREEEEQRLYRAFTDEEPVQNLVKSQAEEALCSVERLIAILESRIKDKEDELLRLTTRGTDILDTINNYELSKSNATPSEQEEIDLKIQNCEDQYKANNGEITKIKAAIDELESDLSDARGIKNTLEYKISQETTVVPTTASSSKKNGSTSSSSSCLSKSN